MASNPTNATDQVTTDATVSAFTTTLVVNVVVGILYYVAYVIASRFESNSDVYFKNLPKVSLCRGIFNPDRFRNWDGAATVYVTRTMSLFFAVVGFLGAAILIPIYGRGSAQDAVGMVTFTIGHLAVESRAIWASWTFSLIFTVLTVLAAWILMNISEELFRKIISSKHMAYRTMLCCRMPEGLKASQVEAVYKELNPHYLAMAMVVDNFDVVNKVTKLRHDLEHIATKMIIGKKTSANRYLPLPKRPLKSLWSPPFVRVDQLIYDAAKLVVYSRLQQEFKHATAANVLYETPLAASIATSVPLKPDTFKRYRFVNVRHDVIWENTGISFYAVSIRKLATVTATAVITLLWGIISLFIASIASIPTLTTVLPFLSPILDVSPIIKGLLTGLVPPLVIRIVFSLVPAIFGFLLNVEGLPLKSRIQIKVYARYFAFVVLNILLVSSIGGSIFSTINTIVNNPTSIVSTLSSTIPKVSTFFINYVLLLACLEPAGYLLNIGGLLMNRIVPLFTNPSPRDLDERSKPDIFQPSVFFAHHALVAVIGITYMVIAPIVTVFCCLYFAVYTVVHAYKFVHVYTQPPAATETAYKMMNMFANQLFVGLYIHQIILIGLFSLRVRSGLPLLILEVIVLVNTALAHSTLRKLFPTHHANPLSMFSTTRTGITTPMTSTSSTGSPTIVAPQVHTASAATSVVIDMSESPMSPDELKAASRVERRIHDWLAQPSVDPTVWIPDDGADTGSRSAAVAAELAKIGVDVKRDGTIAFVEDGRVKVREQFLDLYEDGEDIV
ncbi:hypothetical protein SeMB42_g02791 [Synchytrium endobioticum]|nr:hypothetical protein SeMB42_g02791 [Synchytrium endobioticum]